MLVGALALALTMLVPALPVLAKPGNSLNAKSCQKAGWLAMATANGVSFTSQDECVANGANGGTYGNPASVFAIAFTNRDGVAGFDRAADVLIAELVDTNRDNAVNAGDTVHMGGYPLDFAASAFGTFGVTSHTVTGVDRLTDIGISVLVGPTKHSWGHFAGVEEFYEEYNPNVGVLVDLFDDLLVVCDNPDSLNVNTASLSEPSVQVDPIRRCLVGDNSLIGVTLNQP